MTTSSPGSVVAAATSRSADDAPVVTTIRLGSTSIPCLSR